MRQDPAAADIAQRYARRADVLRYSMLQPQVWHTVQERQRALIRRFQATWGWDLSQVRLLEVGCGAGGNLLEMLRLGLDARHLAGIELIESRWQQARSVLPEALTLTCADACQVGLGEGAWDVVMQFTVFSSLLDDGQQERLAEAMWQAVRPGGVVLWYDFTVNNPQNADVRGVPIARIRELFPLGHVQAQRITLAPPVARWVCRWHPGLYHVFNALPWLRTHCLAWITKPSVTSTATIIPSLSD